MFTEPNVVERLAAIRRMQPLTRRELLASGLRPHAITERVRDGTLIRVRRGYYVLPDVPAEIMDAVRTGGRVACLTLLRMIGVFVLDEDGLHLQVPPHLSRSRHRWRPGSTMHWGECTHEGLRHCVSVWDAVRQAVRCQTPRAAIATIDSVLHHGLLTPAEVAGIFQQLPRRFQALLPLVDASAESGPETFMRLILRALGLPFETQVRITGVGRVDFVVCGWLIIECDSRAFHEGWNRQVEDRRRDLAAARQGYVTIRPLASDIFHRPDEVRAAVQEVVSSFQARPGAHRPSQHPSQLRRTGATAGRRAGKMRAAGRISGVVTEGRG